MTVLLIALALVWANIAVGFYFGEGLEDIRDDASPDTAPRAAMVALTVVLAALWPVWILLRVGVELEEWI